MKKSHLILVSLLVISALIVGFTSNNQTQEKKYEYKTILVMEGSIGDNDAEFNLAGVEGYRMIRADKVNANQSRWIVYIFEKEVN